MSRRAQRGVLFAYALILFAAFALRLWNLGAQSLWHDEGWSLYPAYTLIGPMGIRGMDVNAPPLFNITIGLWLRVAGDEIWTVRFWSLLTGVIGVAAGMALAGGWFGARAGVLAGIFLAFSPLLWVFAQEIRAYIPMPIYTVLLIGLAARFVAPRGERLPSWAWWALFGVTLAALWSHNLSVPLVAWLNVTVIGGLLVRRAWRRLLGWLALQSLLFALYLPWLLTQRPTGTPLNTPPALALELLWQIWQSYFTGIKALLNADDLLMALIAAFGGVALVGIGRALWQERSARTLTLLSAALGLPIFQLLIVLAARIDFHPRYFLLSAPPTLILIAAGLSFPSRRLTLPVVRLAAALIALAIMGRVAWLTANVPIYQHDDFRGMARHYAALSERDAIVIPYGWEPSLDYYEEKLGIRAAFVEVPIHSDAERIRAQLAEALRGKERVEVFTWYQLPADLRGTFPCLLGAVGAREGELTLSGVHSLRFRLTGDPAALKTPYLEASQPISLRPPDDVALLPRLALLHAPGGEAACLIADFATESASLRHDWRMTVRLWRADGSLYAQQDADLRDDRQRSATAQPEGFRATAFFALPVADEPLLVTAFLYEADRRSASVLLGTLTGEAGVARLMPNVNALPSLSEPPELPVTVAAMPFRCRDAELGALIGADAPERLAAGRETPIRLLWRAAEGCSESYVAFVHLIGADGALIAQGDSEPMGGARPTDSWRADEYILDAHLLTWRAPDYRGEATVRIGWYDLSSGARLTLPDGGEWVALPRKVMVE